MIYFASYLDRQFHHGDLISISVSVPSRFKVDGYLPYFAPSPALLRQWQHGSPAMTEADYVARYRQEQMAVFESQSKPWLDSLRPDKDQTLLCWEKTNLGSSGEIVRPFCHRYLVAKIVEKHRPDCYGGCDVPNVAPQLELFPVMGS